MNRLSAERREEILLMLCIGASLHGVTRVAGVSINTVTKLLIDAGRACAELNDIHGRGLEANRFLCRRSWSPIVGDSNAGSLGEIGVWSWFAMEAETELVAAHHIGGCAPADAKAFMWDLEARIAAELVPIGKRQAALMSGQDRLISLDISTSRTPDGFSPWTVCSANPDELALPRRMEARRFTRLRNAHFHKVENLRHMVAIHIIWHNYIKSWKGSSRAVRAGLADRRWTWKDITAAMDGLANVALSGPEPAIRSAQILRAS